jgi:hypothetical protein
VSEPSTRSNAGRDFASAPQDTVGLKPRWQWILKIGVWARYEMEGGGRLGKEILKRFFDYECSREKRRKIKGSGV